MQGPDLGYSGCAPHPVPQWLGGNSRLWEGVRVGAWGEGGGLKPWSFWVFHWPLGQQTTGEPHAGHRAKPSGRVGGTRAQRTHRHEVVRLENG